MLKVEGRLRNDWANGSSNKIKATGLLVRRKCLIPNRPIQPPYPHQIHSIPGQENPDPPFISEEMKHEEQKTGNEKRKAGAEPHEPYRQIILAACTSGVSLDSHDEGYPHTCSKYQG